MSVVRKVRIEFVAEFFGEADAVPNPQLMIEAWMHGMADTDNEAIDPNTGHLLGLFDFTSVDRNIWVEVKPDGV